jgi:hypothetical protein
MLRFTLFSAVLIYLGSTVGFAATPNFDRLPHPRLNDDSWIMIEVWPDVKAMTLSAYFLDGSTEKNRNLCEATKRVLIATKISKVRH